MELNKVFTLRVIFVILVFWLVIVAWILLRDSRVQNTIWQDEWQPNSVDSVGENNLLVNKNDRPKFYIRQNGNYWILYNYVVARRAFKGNESITYTTHGEYTFLDNLETLIKRWRAPMSIALFACGTDFDATLNSIRYLRLCSSSANMIRDFVTFHIFFDENHLPDFIPKTEQQIFDLTNSTFNCSDVAPFLSMQYPTYRAMNTLLYPINVARNIARLEARTYFVFPLDIELFPSINFVGQFLKMASDLKLANSRSVFPVAIFEIQLGNELPRSKKKLQSLLHRNVSISFHASFAMYNHAIPNLDKWIKSREPASMQVFEAVKRDNDAWEPFYVTINEEEPMFDERFSWEGQYDKRIQADTLTLMDYDFLVLDKAFLMHRPGIKIYRPPDEQMAALRAGMQETAQTLYRTQLWKLYGQLEPIAKATQTAP